MSFDTLIALCLLEQLVAALRANDPDLFKRWLIGGVQDLGKPALDVWQEKLWWLNTVRLQDQSQLLSVDWFSLALPLDAIINCIQYASLTGHRLRGKLLDITNGFSRRIIKRMLGWREFLDRVAIFSQLN